MKTIINLTFDKVGLVVVFLWLFGKKKDVRG